MANRLRFSLSHTWPIAWSLWTQLSYMAASIYAPTSRLCQAERHATNPRISRPVTGQLGPSAVCPLARPRTPWTSNQSLAILLSSPSHLVSLWVYPSHLFNSHHPHIFMQIQPVFYTTSPFCMGRAAVSLCCLKGRRHEEPPSVPVHHHSPSLYSPREHTATSSHPPGRPLLASPLHGYVRPVQSWTSPYGHLSSAAHLLNLLSQWPLTGSRMKGHSLVPLKRPRKWR